MKDNNKKRLFGKRQMALLGIGAIIVLILVGTFLVDDYQKLDYLKTGMTLVAGITVAFVGGKTYTDGRYFNMQSTLSDRDTIIYKTQD